MAGKTEGGNNTQILLLAALLAANGGGTFIGSQGQNKVVEQLAELRKSIEKATDEIGAQRRELTEQGERIRFIEADHGRRLNVLESIMGKVKK
ncbi:MAG: hypothetical protein JWQ89_3635 [Devosia sp.]|uniref:hypothetical protein n=1 Tax=Devosia sp. TaxID=1871048 RepID=UPI00261492F2|nr:hypothetical protein [Devosia sp.]MDB5541908.1 hypothetical protein [Devosia sp.]